MSAEFDVSVLPGLPPPGSILVIRGGDFGEDDSEIFRAIYDHYKLQIPDMPPDTPAGKVLPLILILPPEGEAVVWSEDIEPKMAALGWVRKP